MSAHVRMLHRFERARDSGTLASVSLLGTRKPGALEKDWFILGFEDRSGRYCHVFDTTATREDPSADRLRRAVASPFECAMAAPPETVMQLVYDAGSEIVITLVAGTNVDGTLFAELFRYRELPELAAKSMLRVMFSRFLADTRRAD